MKTCLIIDDSRIVRKVSARIVEDLKFDVTEAEHGLDGLQQCRENMPDCILLDHAMPTMNGLDFLKTLRQEPGGQAPVVIYCSNLNDIDHIVTVLDAGAQEVILKPFDADIMRDKFIQTGLI